MSIADKLTYLNETKSLLREAINAAGGNLTQETPFREYAEGWLRDQSASLNLDFSKQQYVAKDKVSMFPDRVGLEDIVTFTRSTGGGRFNAQGQYEWLPADTPRIDYDPVTGECRGLLIEEQRTRLNTVSAAPSEAQSVAVSAVAQTISFYGTGSVVLSGAHVATLTGAGAYPSRREVTFTPTAGTLTITPTGDVRMLQLEAGSFATSPIIGEGSQVTRAADIASVNELSPWYRGDEGTLFVEGVRMNSASAPVQVGIHFTGNVANINSNRIVLYEHDASFGVAIGSATQTAILFTQSKTFKHAGAYKASNFVASYNGLTSTSTGVLSPAVPTVNTLWVGHRAGAHQLNGHIHAVRYYPRRLSNSELQEITT